MKITGTLICMLGSIFLFSACQTPDNPATKEAPTKSADISTLTPAQPPASILSRMEARGEQDQAAPELIVESPTDGASINSSTVKINVRIAGDLKGLKMGKDGDGHGNHVHVILDNQPYAAHYQWNEGFELRNVSDGKHTLRMFASRPWHESYKNKEAFKTIEFTVTKGGADETKPARDDQGKILADPVRKTGMAEGIDVKPSNAGNVDFTKPLLTYSRPKGDYQGKDGEAIMIDFWLSNASLSGDGGDFKIRYSVNGADSEFIERWNPVWLEGWKLGKNTIKLELTDSKGILIENGGYNSTTREFTVSK